MNLKEGSWSRFDGIQFLVFTTVAVIFSFVTIRSLSTMDEINLTVSIIFAAMIYVVSHILRIVRLYILFIETRFSFMQILKIYVLTSWVNFVIPFKLGEVHRIAEFSRLCKSFKMGFVSLWIERFFDSIIVVTILLIISFNQSHYPFSLFIILIALIAVSLFCFLSFPSSFRYLNILLLSESKSHKGLYFLRVLSSLKDYYEYARKLLRGRVSILLGISLLIWGLEIVVYWLSIASLQKNINLFELNFLFGGLWDFKSYHLDSEYKLIVFLVLVTSAVFVLIKVAPQRIRKALRNLKNENLMYSLKQSTNKKYRNL